MDMIVDVFGNSLLLVFLAYGVYWLTEWVKTALKIPKIWYQPVALVLGTLLATGVMFNYGYRPLDFGVSRWVLGDYIFQGMLVSAFSGYLYDKFFR